MTFDLTSLKKAIASEGRVARVVVSSAAGSAPREVGASMLVLRNAQIGTIGGGALEFEAAARARGALAVGKDRLDKVPLGPDLGQCCGGAVLLLTEIWDMPRLRSIGDAVVRPMPGFGGEIPLKVAGRLRMARSGSRTLSPEAIQGWFIEPIAAPERDLWIWGAGHVGRALVGVLAPLPGLRITWVDVAADRFPGMVPEGVTVVPAADAAGLVAHAPRQAEHLVLTYSHALDLDLCHRLLAHGFARLGLIGSTTKWARFRSRLATLGHAPAEIAQIECPIGDPALGKHPQSIAVGVAVAVLRGAAVTRERAVR